MASQRVLLVEDEALLTAQMQEWLQQTSTLKETHNPSWALLRHGQANSYRGIGKGAGGGRSDSTFKTGNSECYRSQPGLSR